MPGAALGIVDATMDKTKNSVLVGLSSGRIEKPRETGKNPEKPTERPRGNCMERPRDRRGTEDRSAEMERAVDLKTETEQRDMKV